MLVGRVRASVRACVRVAPSVCVAVLAAAASMYTRVAAPRTICVWANGRTRADAGWVGPLVLACAKSVRGVSARALSLACVRANVVRRSRARALVYVYGYEGCVCACT